MVQKRARQGRQARHPEQAKKEVLTGPTLSAAVTRHWVQQTPRSMAYGDCAWPITRPGMRKTQRLEVETTHLKHPGGCNGACSQRNQA